MFIFGFGKIKAHHLQSFNILTVFKKTLIKTKVSTSLHVACHSPFSPHYFPILCVSCQFNAFQNILLLFIVIFIYYAPKIKAKNPKFALKIL